MANPLDQYPNLPGIITTLQDGGLQTSAEPIPAATRSVLILGFGTDGPVMDPVPVGDHNIDLFGAPARSAPLPAGATLYFDYQEARAGGCLDIRAMRLAGEYATAVLSGPTRSVTTYELVEKAAGTAVGNLATTITPANKPDTGTLKVEVRGKELAPETFTVDELTGAVTIQANVVSGGEPITLRYSYTVDGTTYSAVENGAIDPGSGEFTQWVTKAQDQTITLNETPATESGYPLVVLADGVAVDSAVVTVNGSTVTVKGGVLTMGVNLVVRYYVAKTAVSAPTIQVTGYWPGSLYHQVRLRVEMEGSQKKLVITKPETKRTFAGDAELTYNLQNFDSYQRLVDYVNQDPENNVIRLATDFPMEDPNNLVPVYDLALAGGDDGLNQTPESTYELLNQAYTLLENYPVDLIVPPSSIRSDMVLADPAKNFADQLALACAVLSVRNKTVFGVIATSSPKSTSLADLQTHAQKLLALGNNRFMRDRRGNILTGQDGKPIDVGGYLFHVAGPDVIFNDPIVGRYAKNSAAYVAGIISQLGPDETLIDAPVPVSGDNGLRFKYGNSILDQLTGARFITFSVDEVMGQTVVVDFPTSAQSDSDYRRGRTVLSVADAVEAIHDAARPYRRKTVRPYNINAMQTAMERRLEQLVEAGALTDATVRVYASPADQVLGNSYVELTLVPAGENRRINLTVRMRPA